MALKILLFHTNADYLIGLRMPLLRYFAMSDAEVVAYAPNMSARHREILQANGIRGEAYQLDATGMNPLKDIKSIWLMQKIARRENPEIVLANNIKPVIYGTLAALLANVKYRYCLISGLGHAFIPGDIGSAFKRNLARRIAEFLYWVAFRAATAVIFQNPDDKDELVDAGICPARKANLVAGSGVDIEQFAPPRTIADEPVCVMVGRVTAEKGVREFFEAASIVKLAQPDVRFILIGAPDTNPSALKKAEIEDIAAKIGVEWQGVVENVEAWLHQSSIFVLPSYREGVPRSTLEAMSCGLPVITTDVPGCRETVQHGLNGFLVPPRDAHALADAILELCANSEERRRMGAESRRLAVDKFDVRNVNSAMAKIMQLQHLVES